MKSFLAALALCITAMAVHAQPLVDPYPFAFGPTVQIDTAMLPPTEPAGARGRVKVSEDGHFTTPDGQRLRFFGVTLQYSACIPDSLTAIAVAQRLRALGVNAVRFNAFDLSLVPAASILAAGTTTSALDPGRMRRFDWFIHQLKQQGIYSVLTFHSAWQPLEGDGVRQRDSVGWGTRVPIFFDPVVQRIHRRIIRMVLEHVNPFTGAAYKDETAIPYIIAVEDAALVAYWMYSADITRPNLYGTPSLGSQHLRLIDSLFNASLRAKGLGTDAALNAAWGSVPSSTANRVQNGGFEDPFSAVWVLGVNTTNGAQAIEQISDADKKEGSSSYRLRIGRLTPARNAYEINVMQGINPLPRDKRFRLSFWTKTTPQRGERSMLVQIYNSTYPYNSYGLQQTITISSEWQKFDMVFSSTSTDEATAALSFMCGADSGDVYLDDVRLVEEGYPGLEPGESITQSSVRRSSFWDATVSPRRAKDVADFYRSSLTQLFDGVRRLVRDTLQSDVLLCPSTRIFSFIEQDAARQYDVTSSTEWRGSQLPMLREIGGAGIYAHTQSKITGKPHVVSHASIQYPRPYQNDMMSVVPSYAGLHDWDAYFPGIFASGGVMAADRIDSNVVWELFNKPNILALMPAASQRFVRGDVVPSPKTIEIAVEQRALDNPRQHAVNPFSLSVYSDVRMVLYRTITTGPDIAAQGSFLPHREISALTGDVDLRALDAENEQIFWDAATGVQRVITPQSVSVTGRLAGEIFDLGPVRVEQLDTVPHAAVHLTTLDTSAIDGASTALLTVSTRALNEGATWRPDLTELDRWGRGNVQMEAVGVRVTVPSGGADSCIVRPLGADGRPKGTPIIATRGATGRFSFVVRTGTAQTPWYRVDFVRIPTSVDADEPHDLRITHDAASQQLRVHQRGLQRVDLVDVAGSVVGSVMTSSDDVQLDLRDVSSGMYVVRVVSASGAVSKPLVHVR